ncbi:MAG: hypothetical protein V7K40_32020 [Nostoc sp.]|uniref:hypothetical protein n=1 Tax=Nostoc sp. TaxID=1180 RepID=UPI002FF83B14
MSAPSLRDATRTGKSKVKSQKSKFMGVNLTSKPFYNKLLEIVSLRVGMPNGGLPPQDLRLCRN